MKLHFEYNGISQTPAIIISSVAFCLTRRSFPAPAASLHWICITLSYLCIYKHYKHHIERILRKVQNLHSKQQRTEEVAKTQTEWLDLSHQINKQEVRTDVKTLLYSILRTSQISKFSISLISLNGKWTSYTNHKADHRAKESTCTTAESADKENNLMMKNVSQSRGTWKRTWKLRTSKPFSEAQEEWTTSLTVCYWIYNYINLT